MESADYILSLIVGGYYFYSLKDRWVFVNNPKYKDGTIDGESEDPYIMYDTYGEWAAEQDEAVDSNDRY